MYRNPEVTGIILAGGKSSRMGLDKGLLGIGGKKLAELAVEKLGRLCSRVVISTNSAEYASFGVDVVPDLVPGTGPMGGIYSVLKKGTTPLCLVLSVDLPFANEGLLSYLVQKAEGFQAAVPWSGNEHYEPLCACYRSEILPLMEASVLRGNYKLPDLFRELKVNRLSVSEELPFYSPYLFLNVNTPEELQRAVQLFPGMDR